MPVAFPNELYLAILHHLEDYPIALARCSRVSKAFRDYAQPILWGSINLRYQQEGRLMVKGAASVEGNRLGRIARKLRIQPLAYTHQWGLQSIAETLPDVEEVWIEDVRPFEEEEVVAFSQLTNLKNLTLTDLFLPLSNDPRSFHYPHLTRLSLNNLGIPWAVTTSLLTVSSLPSLKALALGGIREAEDREAFYYFPDIPVDLLARLDMLQFGRPDFDEDDFLGTSSRAPYLPSNLDPDLVPLLACADPELVWEAGVVPEASHVAMTSSQGWAVAVQAMFYILLASRQIKSFWLPISLQPPETSDEQARWRRFARECRDRSVDIHWMDIKDCPASGGILMEDFLPFAKELRRKERDAKAGTEP